MSIIKTNPLSPFDRIFSEAIEDTYRELSQDGHHMPSIEDIRAFISPNFYHSLSYHIPVAGQFEAVGAEDQDDFYNMLNNGNFDLCVPNEEEIFDYLLVHSLGFTVNGRHEASLYNSPIVEVW